MNISISLAMWHVNIGVITKKCCGVCLVASLKFKVPQDALILGLK